MKLLESFIRSKRQQLERDLLDSNRRWYFSPAAYSQYQITRPLIEKFARGRLIDLGCGDMPFRVFVAPHVRCYESLDFFPRRPDVTYVSDIQNMEIVQDSTYDTALCIEVLEHVPDPARALKEISRILKPDGQVVISVPHLSRLHDEPHDYYRYTEYGLRYLLNQAGLEIVILNKRGGIFSFVGHQLSTFLLGISWGVPLLQSVCWHLNKWLVTLFCWQLDRWLDPFGRFALGYSLVARKVA